MTSQAIDQMKRRCCMKRLLAVLIVVVFGLIVAWVITSCGASGYRLHAGVDMSISSIKRDSTRTVQVTVSGSDSTR